MKKTNYGSWMPENIIRKTLWVTIILGILFIAFCGNIIFLIRNESEISILEVIALLVTFVLLIIAIIFYRRFKFMRKTFDLDQDKSLSIEIVNFVANHMILDFEGKILDVGCGSGALSIAVAKKNPKSRIIGIDMWEGSYKEFSKEICDKNAKIENVDNVEFYKDSAVKLGFPDESFDGLVSNYVYHNIFGDKQRYILESLRVVKKGGKFAIHDLFSKFHYGNLEELKKKLDALGLEKYEFIDTAKGKPIDVKMAKLTMLKGSKLLVGIK